MKWTFLLPLALAAASVPALSAQAPDFEARMEKQRDAMRILSMLDGIWRGPAWALTPSGRQELVQNERVGPAQGGAVKLVEGRGYHEDGSVGFNALGIISYDPDRQAYSIHTHAQGYSGTYPLRPTADGFEWEVPAGPGAVIRYRAVVRDGMWHEVGDRIAGDAPPQRIYEMRLQRLGDTDWPEAGAVPMR